MSNTQEITVKESHRVNLGRHQSQCSVCLHPNCTEIEEKWINWGNTWRVADTYKVSRDAIYRHAHVLDLFRRRRQNVLLALEKLIERVDWVDVSGANIVSAINTYVKLTSPAQATKQAQGTNPKEVFERMSPDEHAAFAPDSTLPDSCSGAKGATPSDSPEGVKESQVTVTEAVQ